MRCGRQGTRIGLWEEVNLRCWKKTWIGESVWSRRVAGDALPASLREVRCTSTTPTALRSFRGVFVSDKRTCIRSSPNAPQGLNQALSSSFSLATQAGARHQSILQTKSHKPKLGLFASSTPFVTGRPHTLIFNGSVKSSGAVGLTLSGGSRPVAETAFSSPASAP